MTDTEPHAGRLRLAVAGCRYFTGPVAEAARRYEGLADVIVLPCETESERPDAHLEEPDSVLTPLVVERIRLEAPDAVVVAPGHRGMEPGLGAAHLVALAIEPSCLLASPRRAADGPTAVVLRPAAVSAVLAATLLEHPDRYAYLPFLSADHLRSQLAIARRAGVASVVTEPAAVPVARGEGLAAQSFVDLSRGCVAVHALERALARAVLTRLRQVAHLGAEADPPCTGSPAAAPGVPRLGEVGTPEVVALRTGRRFVLVPQASITYVSSLGGVVTAFADGGRFWTNQTLAEIERRLDASRFLRIDQSHLVNVTRIGELVPWTHQRYRLVLADAAKTEVVLSRDVGRRLRAAMGW